MTNLFDAWSSIVRAGNGIFPYLGVAVICIVILSILALVLYLAYKLLKRVPPILRYVGWTIARLWARSRGRFVRSEPSATTALIRLGDTGQVLKVNAFFKKRVAPADRSKPLKVVFSGAGSNGALEDALGLSRLPAEGCHATWWNLPQSAVLQIHLQAVGKEFAVIEQIASQLARRRVEPPVGLLVELPLNNPSTSEASRLASLSDLQLSMQAFGSRIGYQLPLWAVSNQSLPLSGELEAARILGAQQLAEWTRWQARGLDDALDLAELQRISDRMRYAIISALAQDEQEYALGARERARALALPESWLQMAAVLPFLRAPEKADPAVKASFPQLAALEVLVSDRHIGDAEFGSNGTPAISRYAPWLQDLHPRPPANAIRVKERRRATVRMTAVAVGAACSTVAGVVVSVRHMDGDAQGLERSIALIQNELQSEHRVDLLDEMGAAEANTRQVMEMLRSIAEASKASSTYVLVPGSWADSPKSKLQERQGELLRDLVVVPRIIALVRQDDGGTEFPPSTRLPTIANSSQELQSFAWFRSVVEQKRSTMANLEIAQQMSDDATYQSLLALLGKQASGLALQGVELQESLPKRVREKMQLQGALDGIVQKEAQEIAPALWEQVLEEALDQHPLVLDAEHIQKTLELVARGRDLTVPEVTEMARLMQRVRSGSQSRNARRLLGKPADTVAFFSGGMTRLMRDGSLSVSQIADTTEAIERHRDQTRRKLLSLTLPGDLRMFSENSDGQMALTADFERLSAAWSAFSAQDFMQAVATPVHSTLEYAGGWDVRRLQGLKGMQGHLRDFLDSGVAAFDPALKAPLRRLASQQTRAVARSMMLSAAFNAPENVGLQDSMDPLVGLRPQISSIVAAANLYRQTLVGEDRFEEDDPAAALLHRSAVRLLSRMHTALAADDPYGSIVRDVGAWMKRSQGALTMATTLGGPPKERLASAREYVVSQYAGPATALLDVVQMVASTGIAREPELQWWRRFVDTVEGFDKGATTNGLVEFEQYLLTLGKSRPDDCAQFLAEWPVSVRRSDHFSLQLSLLEKTVAASCAERELEGRQKAYEDYAKWFNHEVISHFPFGPLDTVALTRDAFAASLEKFGKLRTQIGPSNTWPPAVAEFLRNLDTLHAQFLGPRKLLADTGGKWAAKPTEKTSGVGEQSAVATLQPLQFHARLRGGAEDASLAKHIIDASLNIADRAVGVRSASSAIDWRPGEPIEVRLRWAADSPYAPVGDANSAYKVSGRTAVFHFGGDWALVELLRSTSVRQGLRETLVSMPVTVISEGERAEVDFVMRLTDQSGAPFRLVMPKRAPMLSLGDQPLPSFRVQQARMQ